MKRIVNIFAAIIILIMCCGCGIDKRQHRNEWIPMLLHGTVSSYYYYYFKFPETVDDIINYEWSFLDQETGRQFRSYNEFLNSPIDKSSYFEQIWRLNYLIANKENITIKIAGSKFLLKSKDGLYINEEADACLEKNMFGKTNSIFIYTPSFYNSEGYVIDYGYSSGHDNYGSKLMEETNRLKRKYKGLVDSISFNNEIIPRYALLRYERDKGLSSVCTDDSLNFQSPFLIQLDSCLTDFVKDKKEIEKIVFLTKMVK